MKLYRKAAQLSQYLLSQSKKGKSAGFIPTMGALHDGHLSLVASARQKDDLVVCSIFINPTQFNNPDDFAKYPVTIEQDIERLLDSGCDVLFLPAPEEIYPVGYTPSRYDLGYLETVLEGAHRPGHFQGVCQVVHSLLQIVQPNNLYLGAKDYQQVKVIARLLELLGLEKSIRINTQPTLREVGGLAMSSRNLRLSSAQRAKAAALFRTLEHVKSHFQYQHKVSLENDATESLTAAGFKVDYFTIADAETLLHPSPATKKYIALAAAFLDEIRLIDNLELTAGK